MAQSVKHKNKRVGINIRYRERDIQNKIIQNAIFHLHDFQDAHKKALIYYKT